KQYLTNIDQASSFLNTTDSALDAVTSALSRVRELAVQAANDTMGASDRASIGAEVTQLQQHVLDLAGTKYGAYYVFAGPNSAKPGYTQAAPSSTAGAYQGNNQGLLREISPGATMTVNVDAQATFDPTFAAMQSLQTGIQNGDQQAITNSL